MMESTDFVIGSTLKTAIIIDEKYEPEGVHAEYVYLDEQFPNYISVMQRVEMEDGIQYDIIDIITDEGDILKIHFNINQWYGKYENLEV